MDAKNNETTKVVQEIVYMGVKVGEVEARTSEYREFACDLVCGLLEELEPIVDKTFFMIISDYGNFKNEPSYKISLTNAVREDRDYAAVIDGFKSKPEEFMQLFSTELDQPYFLLSAEHPEGNHGGVITIQIAMFANEDTNTKGNADTHEGSGDETNGGKDCKFIPNYWAKPLAHIALGRYRQIRHEHSPNRQMLCLDKLDIDSFMIDRVSK